MKYKHVIIASALFFLLINTLYFWEGQTGMFALPILLIYYLILLGKFVQYVSDKNIIFTQSINGWNEANNKTDFHGLGKSGANALLYFPNNGKL